MCSWFNCTAVYERWAAYQAKDNSTNSRVSYVRRRLLSPRRRRRGHWCTIYLLRIDDYMPRDSCENKQMHHRLLWQAMYENTRFYTLCYDFTAVASASTSVPRQVANSARSRAFRSLLFCSLRSCAACRCFFSLPLIFCLFFPRKHQRVLAERGRQKGRGWRCKDNKVKPALPHTPRKERRVKNGSIGG